MRKSRRSGIVSGVTLIVAGLLLFWLDRQEYLGQDVVLFIIGSLFIGGYLYGKNYGLLIPGCLLLGLGTGSVLENLDIVQEAWPVGLGCGFIAVYFIALLYERRSHWWPLIPGGVLLINAFSSFQKVVNIVFDNWPLALVAVGIFILIGTFGGRGSKAETP
jgi:hypothetical protein